MVFRPLQILREGHLWRPPVSTVLKRQLYFTGIESLTLIMLIAIAVGGIIVNQVHQKASGSDTLRLLALITLNELGPILTALILIARSSSAMASELAAMRVTGEIDTLHRLGVPTLDYLVMPRVTGMVFSSLFLSMYFAACALLTAAFYTAGFNGPHELVLLADSLPFQSVGQGVVKSLLFGFAIALTACRAGLAGGGTAMTDIPKAASKAVINSLLTVFAIDLLVLLV